MEHEGTHVVPLRRGTPRETAASAEPTQQQRDYWAQVQRLRAEREGLRPVG